eukprot:COSAG06_NODE_1032_length_11010_cov_13.156448_9_plen_51_part_00
MRASETLAAEPALLRSAAEHDAVRSTGTPAYLPNLPPREHHRYCSCYMRT